MTATEVQNANQQLADSINDEARRNPHSQYAGKIVGIAEGQVVVVADDWDELDERMRQLVADPSNTLSLEVGLDYEQAQEIWGLR
ncbi:MAG TPA: hypothetical protein VHR66_09785 [Gemmataceae bacterium]|nr:hypothetical protein [Gemmataceae bacterium]